MAQERQLFVFTCHPFFAEETTEHPGAERIDLTALQTEDDSVVSAQRTEQHVQDRGISQ